jgi:hypothetical protein
MEVCCSPQSVLAEECIKLSGNAVRINLANGYDLGTRHGIERAKQKILKQRPRESWISLPCTLWSSAMQNLSNGKRRDEAEFQEKRRQSRRMIRMAIELVKVMIVVGCQTYVEKAAAEHAHGRS